MGSAARAIFAGGDFFVCGTNPDVRAQEPISLGARAIFIDLSSSVLPGGSVSALQAPDRNGDDNADCVCALGGKERPGSLAGTRQGVSARAHYSVMTLSHHSTRCTKI